MQAPFDIAADLDTPVSAYLKLGSLKPRFLLESVEGGERLARYSFLGFGDAVWMYGWTLHGLTIAGERRVAAGQSGRVSRRAAGRTGSSAATRAGG